MSDRAASPSWVQTYTGLALDLLDPRPEQVSLEDIAHSLSMQCRCNGHSGRFYSVAEHSVLVAEQLAEDGASHETQALGLMHDAAEAYVGDVIAPIKLMPGFEAIRELERRIWQKAIAPRFGLPLEVSAEVKRVDLRMLATEAPQVMTWPPPRDWDLPEWAVPYEGLTIFFLDPAEAKAEFLRAARMIGVRVQS